MRRLVPISAGELTELASAATSLEHSGLEERAAVVRDLTTKLHATLRPDSLARTESDLEALVHTEGLAMRPGPRPRLDTGLVSLLREAITTCRVVEFRCFAQSTRRRSRQRVQPYGLLYGNRAFLVARTDWSDEPRLWRLANVSEARLADEMFERDPALELQRPTTVTTGIRRPRTHGTPPICAGFTVIRSKRMGSSSRRTQALRVIMSALMANHLCQDGDLRICQGPGKSQSHQRSPQEQ